MDLIGWLRNVVLASGRREMEVEESEKYAAAAEAVRTRGEAERPAGFSYREQTPQCGDG